MVLQVGQTRREDCCQNKRRRPLEGLQKDIRSCVSGDSISRGSRHSDLGVLRNQVKREDLSLVCLTFCDFDGRYGGLYGLGVWR